MTKKLVSVIIPSYNHSAFIEQTIHSVLQQTYANLEVIVVDDCSADNSVELINAIEDKRVKKVFLDENLGTVRALNIGLKEANGDYIATLGSDDVWEKDKLEKQVEILESNIDIGGCFSWANMIDENGQQLSNCMTINHDVFIQENRTSSQWFRYFFDMTNCLCHSSALLRKSVYDDLGLYNVAYRQLHDFEYWVKLVNKYEIFIVQEPLVRYRRVEKTNDSVSALTTETSVRTLNELYSIWLDCFSSYMKKETFVEAFKDKLLKKENLSAEELICEAFFILKGFSVAGVNCTALALRFLADKLNDDKILSCLQNEYNFDIKSFYAESGRELLFYPEHIRHRRMLQEIADLRNDYSSKLNQLEGTVKQKQEALSQQEKIIVQQQEAIFQQQNTIKEIYDSTSWKVTQPLRKISKIFHK